MHFFRTLKRFCLLLSFTVLPAFAAPGAETRNTPQGAADAELVKVTDGRMLLPDIARIVNRGELVVAMLAVDTPPFFYLKNGELIGTDVDLAKALAMELKVKVRFDRSAKSFNDVIDRVAKREADLGVSKLSRTLGRAQMVRFSEPYLLLNHSFLINRSGFAKLARGKTPNTVLREFNGTLGVIDDSSFADYASKYFPLAELRAYGSWPEIVQAVEKGEIVAGYRDEFEVKRIFKSDPGATVSMKSVTFKDLNDTLGVAVGNQSPNLLAFVNQFFALSNSKLTVDKVLGALD